ncbi:MAG TPA: c-type cytochrome [Burkholderiaceae bacterium]|nr:c-type cytochrome [Burkholderiaceae bacterium]
MSDEQHVSPIKTPQQLITVVALSFIVPIIAIVLLVKFVVGGTAGATGTAALSTEAVNDRLKPVATIEFAAAGGGAHALLAGEAVFQQVCTACHSAGVAGAPKVGDKAAWSARIAQGVNTLVAHATQGYKTMPAKGGKDDLDPVEVARAVVYMANQSGASFKEPAAPAAK